MEFFRDPIWQFIGAVIAVIAFLYPILVSRKIKSFGFYPLDHLPLLQFSEKVIKRLEIKFDDTLVKNPYLLFLKFTNNGSIPILEKDFIEPLTINARSSSKILALEIAKQTPSNLNVHYKFENNSITITPLIMNPKDSFILRLFYDKSDDQSGIQLSGRILGVHKFSNPNKVNALIAKSSILIFVICLLLTLVGALIRNSYILLFGLLYFFLFSINMIVIFFRMKREVDSQSFVYKVKNDLL